MRTKIKVLIIFSKEDKVKERVVQERGGHASFFLAISIEDEKKHEITNN